ncbi:MULTISPECIES: carbohydrate ABC transporter permease [Actinoplanes]|uniref:carbohydrate ABC transporter permease n=1 Tax=Actinoplanes TaxID=1865 RepID=UPI0005F2DA5B|nr:MULTISPECIES: carbohydrate ABC transporter permease [Actinoplanes]GLX99820.1 ABC transporter permease [Actinoplanes sp. NBRC 101535]
MTAPTIRPAARAPKAGKKKNSRSLSLTAVTAIAVVYTLLPLFWLVVSATKSQEKLFDSFGLWFANDFSLFDNIADTFAYQDGIFGRWLLNTLVYVVIGAGGATLLASLAGYGLAKFDFIGRKAVFAIVLGGIAVPPTVLAVPTFLMFAKLGLTDTAWAIIIPSLVSPFGLYLMWTYATEAVPKEILESARVDGSGEFRTFFSLALPLLAPGAVTVLLFNIVATWNNFFLPLIMLKDSELYPLTLGLYTWSRQANTVGGEVVFNLVVTGALITIIPLITAFLLLQRYWQSGLSAGSVKQ